MTVRVTDDISLTEFRFWGGAEDRVKYLSYDELEELTDMFEEMFPDGISATEVNDFFWFNEDEIARMLGYPNFEAIEDQYNTGEEEDSDDNDEA